MEYSSAAASAELDSPSDASSMAFIQPYIGRIAQTRRPRRGPGWRGLFLELLGAYLRVDIEGAENIPRSGPAIIVPNHSGFAGADALVLAHLIRKSTGRAPKFLAHRGYFRWFGWLRRVAESSGLREANFRNGRRILQQGDLMIVFPEGEDGNFKSSRQRYSLQHFHRGFVVMAMEAGVPVVPCLVIGAEETHINFGRLDLSRWIDGLKLPLPFNLIPLPAKWKIRFLSPVDLSRFPRRLEDQRVDAQKVANDTRVKMQRELQAELRQRRYVFFRSPRWLNRVLEKGVRLIA